MLCCVSRRPGVEHGPPYDQCSSKEQLVDSEKFIQIEPPDEPDVPPILLPCAICARTFMPQSLEKHSKICERSTNKKRKPFDSAKQRIQGTELAEFLPRQGKKRHSPDGRSSKPKSSWKQAHDDLLRTVRAARNEIADSTMQKQCGTTVTEKAPTRANEQGACPTCNRHFGVKAYERHVAWCKERITRMPLSPATNIAKERLEARMKYRAPAVRSRRQATREKYSPSSPAIAAIKTSPTMVAAKAKECASAPSCTKTNNESPVKQKSSNVKRNSGHAKESSPTAPMKSRAGDRVIRNLELPLRPVWSNYVRRRPDFNLVLSGRTGKDYDPFLLAEQQMNDLLSDTSERSVTDSPSIDRNRDSLFPLSHSSAFVKYPYKSFLSSPSEKRTSLAAPPTEFDDLASDFSSDSTETNSLSREVFLKDRREYKDSVCRSDPEKKSTVRELGRRVIIDKSKALGNEVIDENDNRGSRSSVDGTERARKTLDKVSPKVVRPSGNVNRSLSERASSAPKATPTATSKGAQRSTTGSLNNRNNNYANLSGSNLSLSSIMSSDMDMKRSNSMFEEIMTSFEDESSFPSLKSLLKDESLSVSSPVHGRQRNGQISDDELSSPESYKKQDHSKMSADSAYSSLNRKYSYHGRSTNDVAGRSFEEDLTKNNNRRENDGMTTIPKCKMSKFCHECGSRFPETAKFCCECGIRRLVL